MAENFVSRPQKLFGKKIPFQAEFDNLLKILS